jgi:hypothetical protein
METNFTQKSNAPRQIELLGVIEHMNDTKLDFVSNHEGLEDKSCDGTSLEIRTSERTEFVKFPRRFSPSEKEAIINSNVKYSKTYYFCQNFQEWNYQLEVLSGQYKKREILETISIQKGQ